MSPERDIVNWWLNKKGFLTVTQINAGSRVIDFIAVKYEGDPKVWHVEVTCSISANVFFEKDKNELHRYFYDSNVVKSVEKTIIECLGKPNGYEKVLITNFQNLSIEGVTIIKFEDVLFDVVSALDKQRYKSDIIRTIQLLKYFLISQPSMLSSLIASSSFKPMSSSSKETLIKELLAQEKKVFSKPSNEQLLVELLKVSSLKQPERLAAALADILSKRSGTKLLKALMTQKEVKSAIKEELSRDKKLVNYFGK